MPPSRQPDLISDKGTRFWFEEMLCNMAGKEHRLVENDKGQLKINSGRIKGGLARPHIQAAYREWKHKRAEEVLIGTDS